MMKTKRGFFAIAIAAVILATVLFSYAFLAENVHHDCTGETCGICLEMAMAAQTILGHKMISTMPLILAFLCVFTHICAVVTKSDCVRDTLITLKVELLN